MTLVLDQLSFAYDGSPPALNGVSLTVAPAARLAILGSNGAGKSTLLHLMAGLLKPAAGRVLLDGSVLGHDRRSLTLWRSRVGIVMQDPDDQLFAGTVFEDVSFGPLNQGLGREAARARVEDALARLGISDLAGKAPHMLSYGQRKKVAIAGVIAMAPDILLFDEPTAGLDRDGMADLAAVLAMLSSAGKAVVIATHDMDFVEGWAAEVAVFSRGQCLHQGDAADAFADAVLFDRAHLNRPARTLMRAALADALAKGLAGGLADAPGAGADLPADLLDRLMEATRPTVG